jgi:glutathione synthase/RimK-type ligase-like ATP-grasp enzyme
VVVKPSISAGSNDTARYAAGDPRVAAHVARLHAEGRAAMIQPYVEQVDEAGETALIYLGGDYSHSVRKGPMLRTGSQIVDGLYVEEEISPRDPTDDERALAERVIAYAGERFGRLPYARVDLLPGPVLIELELTEPSLFFGHAPGSAERLARALTSPQTRSLSSAR